MTIEAAINKLAADEERSGNGDATVEPGKVDRGSAPASRPFSTFERMVAWRYLRARRKEAFISVIAGFSFVGIMLGVATLIIVMAVMNGFRTELISRILGINGHMIVQPVDGRSTTTLTSPTQFTDVPGVTMAIPLVEGQTLASGTAGAGTGALVRGVRADDLTKLKIDFRQHQVRRSGWLCRGRGRCDRHAHGRPARACRRRHASR